MNRFHVTRNYRPQRRGYSQGYSCSLKVRTRNGRSKTIIRFSLEFVTADGHFGPVPDSKQFAKERREEVELIADFLNSRECDRLIRKAFLDSIQNPHEEGCQ